MSFLPQKEFSIPSTAELHVLGNAESLFLSGPEVTFRCRRPKTVIASGAKQSLGDCFSAERGTMKNRCLS